MTAKRLCVLLAISVFLTYSLVVFTTFPFTGIAVVFITLASIIFFYKPKGSRDIAYYLTILILSLFVVLRANPLLIFLNIIAIVYFTSELLLSGRGNSLFNLVFSPVISFVKAINTKVDLKGAKTKNYDRFLPSLLICVIVLLIIVPLLASANPYFESFVGKLLNLEMFRFFIENDKIYVNIFRLIVLLGFSYLLPKTALLASKSIDIPTPAIENALKEVGYTVPKVAVIIVVSIFFGFQLQLYLSTDDTLMNLGYTYSQYTREIFGQLSVVTITACLLIFFDRSKSRLSRITTYILLAQMYFLNLMALKSVVEYIANWGFTTKRLYGVTIVFWLFAVITLFVFIYSKGKSYSLFLRSVILTTAVTMILVNLANFDKLIYHRGQSITHRGVDYEYLSGLSPDSQSLAQQIDLLSENRLSVGEDTYSLASYRLQRQRTYLMTKYSDLDWRTFNLSEYREYKQIMGN